MAQPIKKVALAVKSDDSSVNPTLEVLVTSLREQNTEIFNLSPDSSALAEYDLPQISEDDIAEHCQAILVVGGDGTFIRYAIGAAKAQVPILGINCGRVGFLTEVSHKEIESTIPAILQGRYLSSSKAVMRGRIHQGKEVKELLSTNDLVVQSLNGRLLEANLLVDDKFVYCERSDGIIVATSAGSSAYALSAGGPLIAPEVDALEVVSISPHTLTSRPLVLPGSVKITIELVNGEGLAVYADGRDRVDISKGDKVTVAKDNLSVPLIHPESYDIFDAYRNKLSWHSTSRKS